MHKHEELARQLDLAWRDYPRDNAKVEMLHAQYVKAWHDFEERVFMECRLPRHELMLKRSNFG